MPWFHKEKSLAHKLYRVFTQTVELYQRPNITILFNNDRRAQYLELVKQFYLLLKDVYQLECASPDEELEHNKNEYF